MSQFVVPFSGDLLIDADTVEEAIDRAYAWRRFVIQSLTERLEELGLSKVVIASMHGIIEVDADWIKNEKLKKENKKEWDYIVHQIAVKPLSE